MIYTNIAANPDKDKIEIFRSLSEFLNEIQSRTLNKIFADDPFYISSKRETDRYCDWSGTPTFPAAVALAIRGDIDTAKKIRNLQISGGTEADTGLTYKRKLIKSVAGAKPIIPLVKANIPINMLSAKRNPHKGRVLNLYYSGAVGSSIKPDDVCANAAKLVSAIQAIETSGIRVNLFAGAVVKTGTGKKDFHSGVFINIKKSTAGLNLPLISFCISHPSFFRRILFRYWETYPEKLPKHFRTNFGYPTMRVPGLLKLKRDEISLSYYDIAKTPAMEIVTMLVGKD